MLTRAIVFDLDGTLLDSLADLAGSVNAMLTRHRWPTHEVDRYRWMVGDGMRTLVQRALPVTFMQDEDTILACLTEVRIGYETHCLDHTRPYPGIVELLAALTVQQWQLAVLTNKPQELAERLLAARLPDAHFSVVAGARPGEPLKPDKQAGHYVLGRLGHPQTVWMVGDSAVDMQTAAACGMHAIGCLWGFRTRQELVDSGATAVVQAPLDILKVVAP